MCGSRAKETSPSAPRFCRSLPRLYTSQTDQNRLEVEMSVSITFEPSGISGVVAQGTYVIDAARRMGAPLGTGCTAGKGECPACVVSISTGAELLSPPSVAEEKQLGVEQLEQALRLACQVKIESHGEVVVQVTSRPQTRASCPKGGDESIAWTRTQTGGSGEGSRKTIRRGAIATAAREPARACRRPSARRPAP